MVRVLEDDADCASHGRPFVCVDLNLRCPDGPRRVCALLKGSGLGLVMVGGGWLGFHRAILTVHRVAVRLFALT